MEADHYPEPVAMGRLGRLESRLGEAFDEFFRGVVDCTDALYDDDGRRWQSVPAGRARPSQPAVVGSEAELRAIVAQCRALAAENEFAINGHENRISYIVGNGHAYRAVPRPGDAEAEPLARRVQAVLDEFVQANRWQKRQQEIVRRKDRDGECFLRWFDGPEGILAVRFVEPDEITTPPQHASDPAASFGIATKAHDVETVLGYYVGGQWVEAPEIQHRKANVDANVKRGLPLFFPVRKNLRRAERLLRNMSVVAEIQSAIALIRKHAAGTRSAVQQFVQAGADAAVANPASGQAAYYRRYGPGTILDAFAGVDYQFPAAGVDASRYVTVLQAELRAIASRLVMPEFMLTSDASNANYASTIVAEGPAMKMFERLQHDLVIEDLEVMRRVVAGAIRVGRLSPDAVRIDLRAIPPTLAVRDRLRDAQADRILVECGAMSVDTMSMRHGMDPDREQGLIARGGGQKDA